MISNFIYFFLNSVFYIVITALALRLMGEDFFGLWSIINSILVFSGIGSLGMAVVIKKFAAEKNEPGENMDAKIISSGILILVPMAVIAGLVLIASRGWITMNMDVPELMREDFRDALVLVGLCLFPQFLSRIPHGYLLAQLKNGLSNFLEFALHVVSWSGAIFIAASTRNIRLMVLWLLIVQMVYVVVLFLFIFRLSHFSFYFDRTVVKKILDFSFYTFISSLAIVFFQQLDRILVGFLLGPAAAGAYAVGTSMSLRLSIVTGQVTDVMVPYASRKNTSNDLSALYRNFRHMSRIINFLLALIAGPVIVFMREILTIWISAEYATSYSKVFSLLVVVYLIQSVSRSGHQTLTGMGHVKFTARVYLVMSLLMIAGLFFLSPRFGLMGAAAANLSIVLLLSFNVYAHIKLGAELSVKELIVDNFLAFSSAAAGYSLISLNAPLPVRIIFSLVVIALVLVMAVRDKFVQQQASQLLKQFLTAISFGKSGVK